MFIFSLVGELLYEQLNIYYLSAAFNLKRATLNQNEKLDLGIVSGLCVIRNGSRTSKPTFVLIDNFSKSVERIAGADYVDICEFVFEGDQYSTKVSIKNVGSVAGRFWVAYQSLGFNF